MGGVLRGAISGHKPSVITFFYSFQALKAPTSVPSLGRCVLPSLLNDVLRLILASNCHESLSLCSSFRSSSSSIFHSASRYDVRRLLGFSLVLPVHAPLWEAHSSRQHQLVFRRVAARWQLSAPRLHPRLVLAALPSKEGCGTL